MPDDAVQSAVPGGDQDWEVLVPLATLTAWMDREGLGEGPIERPRLLTGGTQNILLRFTRAGRDYVLRRPPKHLRANSNETMRREMRVLGALGGTDVRHPALIAGCPDEALIGAAFYLMAPVEGFCPRDEMPALHAGDAAIRHRMGLEMSDAIAALARVDYRAKGLADLGKVDGFLERQTGRWLGQLDSYKAFAGWPGLAGLPDVAKITSWLEANRPPSFEPGLIHGDFHFGNVLFRRDGPELAAIVDWELTTAGDPLMDLGGLLTMWPADDAETGPVKPWSGFPKRAELIARYAEQSGRDVSHADWYEVLASFKLGAILEGTYARACAGQAPKATGDYLHASTIGLFERALVKIGAG
ncbi:MAG TPA: phosphotransferase family protein [Caulobacteraceae bacterium]|nr:phosphotransferase family protein [Caulobacteraceae bacterium]